MGSLTDLGSLISGEVGKEALVRVETTVWGEFLQEWHDMTWHNITFHGSVAYTGRSSSAVYWVLKFSLNTASSSSSSSSYSSLALQPGMGFSLLHNMCPLFSVLYFLPLSSNMHRCCRSCSHLFLGPPRFLLPSILPWRIFFGVLLSSILSTWPNHSSRLDFTNLTISSSFIISCIS